MLHKDVALATSYSSFLIVISILIAAIASYTALNFAGRVTVAQGQSRVIWLIGGALSVGIGIWLMQFIAILALHLDKPIGYDIPTLLASLLAVIVSSGLALFLVNRAVKTATKLFAGGVLAKGVPENEKRFHTLIQNLQVGVLLIGSKLEILVANRLALDLLALNEQHLESKTLLDLDRYLIEQSGINSSIDKHPLVQAIIDSQPIQDLVINVYHPLKNKQVALLVNVEPQLNLDGTLEQIICSFVDITERQQAEAQLQLSELKYRELAQQEILLNNLANQIYNSLELDSIILTAVREIRDLLKIDRCNFFWYIGGADGHKFELVHSACIPTIENIPILSPLQDLDYLGEKILIEDLLKINNLADEIKLSSSDKSIYCCYNTISLLAVTLPTNSGQIGVISCENSTSIRHWSNKEVALLKAVANQIAIAIDQAQLYEESCAMTKAARLQAEQLEQTLLELKETQSQLIHSEKMSSLGQTVAGVAHEINNPVNFIHGNIDHAVQYIQALLNLLHLYQQHYPDCHPEIETEIEAIDLEFIAHDLPKMLNSMKIGTDRIREIVLSLRNFSRLDESDMKVADVHEGIDNTLLILQHRLKATNNTSGIKIIKKYGDLPKIECYPGQLNQVFMNIIGNAIDALEYRKPQLWPANQLNMIRIITDYKYPDTVIIRIADNGSGMNEDVQKRIFDPFFTTKAVGKGTGLGLAISYKIVVERHGGSIRCESKPEQGTEFWIEIPIKQKASPLKELDLLTVDG